MGELFGRECVLTDTLLDHISYLEAATSLRPHVERDPGAILICDGGEFAQWGQSMLPAWRRLVNGVAGAHGRRPRSRFFLLFAIAECATVRYRTFRTDCCYILLG